MEKNSEPPAHPKGPWPEPRVRALQVDELYKFAPMATGFSFFGALLTLGVLIEIGDTGRGALWFLWATAVTFFRAICIVAYRRRGTASHPDGWANLVIAANFLAGIQWGVLGTILFPDGPVYLQLFTLMVIICFVAGSVPAYASVRGAHEALSLPATVPTSAYLFLVHTGQHWYAGAMALFFSFAIVYYARKLSREIEQRFRLQVERDDLLTLTGMLNERLERENRDLHHRVAVRGASMTSARERAERFEALFERSALPQVECDAEGRVLACNPAAERLFGVRHQEIAHRPLTTLLEISESELRDMTHKAEAEIFEVKIRGSDGVRVPCQASFTPLPEIEGRIPGFGVVLTGIPAMVVG